MNSNARRPRGGNFPCASLAEAAAKPAPPADPGAKGPRHVAPGRPAVAAPGSA
jgi:hypothetical protein